MSDLTDFLLPRFAEDEEVATAAREHEYLSAARDASAFRWERDGAGYGKVVATSGRVLAECEAKRRIVEAAANIIEPDPSRRAALEFVCRALALPYADHPDWREEWRP